MISKFRSLIGFGMGNTRHLHIFMLSFVLITASLACSFSLAGGSSSGDRVATSVAQTEAAQREMDLAVTGTIMAQRAEHTVSPGGSSTLTPTAQAPTVTPHPPTPTITPTSRPGVTIDFDALPEGTVIDDDIILEGDEFRSQGVILAGNPVSSYCSDATSSAIEVPPYTTGFPFDSNYLTTALAGDHSTCSTVPVRVDFLDLVSKVEIEFIGCEEEYHLRVFDDTGEPLGTVSELGALDEHTTATYSASAENISSITFGREYCGTMIKEIYFER